MFEQPLPLSGDSAQCVVAAAISSVEKRDDGVSRALLALPPIADGNATAPVAPVAAAAAVTTRRGVLLPQCTLRGAAH